MVERAAIPEEMKEILRHDIPEVFAQLEDATRKVYDPAAIWLESIQFADYVSQLGSHLQENHSDECNADVSSQLITMAESWKSMAEQAMSVLDESEGEV